MKIDKDSSCAQDQVGFFTPSRKADAITLVSIGVAIELFRRFLYSPQESLAVNFGKVAFLVAIPVATRICAGFYFNDGTTIASASGFSPETGGFAGAVAPGQAGGSAERSAGAGAPRETLFDQLKRIRNSSQLYNALIGYHICKSHAQTIRTIELLNEKEIALLFSWLKAPEQLSLVKLLPQLIENKYLKEKSLPGLLRTVTVLDVDLEKMLATRLNEKKTLLHDLKIFVASLHLLKRCTKEQAKKLLEHTCKPFKLGNDADDFIKDSVLIHPDCISAMAIEPRWLELLNYLMEITMDDTEPMFALLDCIDQLVYKCRFNTYLKADIVKFLTKKRETGKGKISYLERWKDYRELRLANELVENGNAFGEKKSTRDTKTSRSTMPTRALMGRQTPHSHTGSLPLTRSEENQPTEHLPLPFQGERTIVKYVNHPQDKY